MVLGLIGRKLGMTQVFGPDGVVTAVTAIEAGPCPVVQVKTVARDGYRSYQIGFGTASRLNKPESGHLKGLSSSRFLREVLYEGEPELSPGAILDVSQFAPGDLIDVVATSKGRGFAGVVKRHHFSGGPKTHGQSDRHRAPGSIGATTTPGKVLKGLRMAGHMGNRRVTVRNLRVVAADPDHHRLLVEGAIPGGKQGLVMVRPATGGKR
ncbi:MAG: 50S ribosomal protein L3 [Chloroflexi bacterium]|nr:50S ribosomal protein L3 [Chloroflexota bacterium]